MKKDAYHGVLDSFELRVQLLNFRKMSIVRLTFKNLKTK